MRGGQIWVDHRFARTSAALLGAVIWLASSGQLFAQTAFISWQGAFNGAPFTGLPTTVYDNGPGDTNLAPGALSVDFLASNGIITVAGTIQGNIIPNGRQLVVTNLLASVPIGYFTPLNTPWPTFELLSCYDFYYAVGPPFNFASALSGSFTNIAGAGNIVNAARVGYTSDSACYTSRPPLLFTHLFDAEVQPADIPFNDFHNFGLVHDAGHRIGGYHYFRLKDNGDAVSLPNSSETTLTSGSSGVPTLPPFGLIVLVLVLMAGGVGSLLHRRVAS